MSLINEALKKAQKQRAEEEATRAGKVPAPGSSAPTTPAEPPPPPTPPIAPSSASPAPEPSPGREVRSNSHTPGKNRKAHLVVGAMLVTTFVVGGWWLRNRTADESNPPKVLATSRSVAPSAGSDEKGKNIGGVDTATSAGDNLAMEIPAESKEPEPSTPQPLPSALPATPSSGMAPPQTDENESEVKFIYEEKSQPGRIAEVKSDGAEQEVFSQQSLSQTPEEPPHDPAPVVTQPVTRSPVITQAPVTEPKQETSSKVDPMSVAVSPSLKPAVVPSTTADSAGQPLRADPQPRVAASQAQGKQSIPAGAGKVVILEESATRTGSVQPTAGKSLSPNAAVLAFLENARVTGVRASATDPKVLMNNRVYRLYDTVERALELRVTKITPRELQFTDARGYVYTKAF
jgi:hypothetical protein